MDLLNAEHNYDLWPHMAQSRVGGRLSSSERLQPLGNRFDVISRQVPEQKSTPGGKASQRLSSEINRNKNGKPFKLMKRVHSSARRDGKICHIFRLNPPARETE
jgi:hypothetical protein